MEDEIDFLTRAPIKAKEHREFIEGAMRTAFVVYAPNNNTNRKRDEDAPMVAMETSDGDWMADQIRNAANNGE